MATLAVFSQVTLDDVYARADSLALDVDAFIELTLGGQEEQCDQARLVRKE